jgi:hypothetical protein
MTADRVGGVFAELDLANEARRWPVARKTVALVSPANDARLHLRWAPRTCLGGRPLTPSSSEILRPYDDCDAFFRRTAEADFGTRRITSPVRPVGICQRNIHEASGGH